MLCELYMPHRSDRSTHEIWSISFLDNILDRFKIWYYKVKKGVTNLTQKKKKKSVYEATFSVRYS